MIESAASVFVNKPAADIFKFVVDVDDIPIWVNGAHVIKITEGPVGPDFQFREGNILLTVRDLQVDRRFETESVRVRLPTRLFLSYSHGVMSCGDRNQVGSYLCCVQGIHSSRLLPSAR